jgi:serine/threonine protein kinase
MKSFERQEQILSSRYEVENSLGSGAWGAVFLATDTALKRKVAIKIMHQHLTHDAGSLDRFNREAEIVSSLVHPNICTLFDKGVTESGRPYMVMEYLDGLPLNEVIAGEGRVSVKRTIQITTQICDALDYAHKRNFVHRDLKPGNIMVLDGDVPKLLDFGLAKWRGNESLTSTGNTVGTPDFMSPEQWCGLDLDGRADIYSLGATMFFMLTGESMVTETGLLPIADFHMRQKPRELSKVTPDLYFPPLLQQIVDRCLEKDRDARFGDAIELKEALLNVLSSARPSASFETKKQSHSGTKVIVAAVSILLTASAVLLITKNAGTSTTKQQPAQTAKPAPPAVRIAAQPVSAPSVTPPLPVTPVTSATPVKPRLAKASHPITHIQPLQPTPVQTVTPHTVLPPVADIVPQVAHQTDGAALSPPPSSTPAERTLALRIARNRAIGNLMLVRVASDEQALAEIDAAPACNQLTVSTCNIDNAPVIAAMKRFPNMNYITVYMTHVDDEIMPLIAQSKVTGAHLGFTAVTDLGVHAIAGDSQIVDLGLEGQAITDVAVSDIARLPLQHLLLRSTHLTPASAGTIAKIGTLESLSVGKTSWDNNAVEAIQKLPHLKRLDLSNTRITDAVIDSIIAMRELEELSVARTRLSDQAIAKLASCPKLRHLDLTGVPASAETARALTQAPDLTVIRWASRSPEGLEAILAQKNIRLIDARRSVFTIRGWTHLR